MGKQPLEKETNNHENRNSKNKKKKREILDEKSSLFFREYSVHVTNLN